MNDIENLCRWVWLSLACGAGSTMPELLISVFGDIDTIYDASEDEYAELDMKLPCLTALCDKNLDQARYIVKWCEIKNVGILTPDDSRYPARLYGIHAYPCVLYYIGRIPAIDKRLTIPCVGTRKMTSYGKNNAYTMSYDLAKHGAVIVSGLALGIDAVCHRAALDAGGDTIAVLGCGLDRAYPPQNRELMVEIARHGTLFTEYAPNTEPKASNFPLRNRIISGLSLATMVYEADSNSGSLITARHAMKQGRPVYALPGNTGVLTSLGTNELLTHGAFAATHAGDILADYEDYLTQGERAAAKKPPVLEPSPVKKIVSGFEVVPEDYGTKSSESPKKPAEKAQTARTADDKKADDAPKAPEKPAPKPKLSKEKTATLIAGLNEIETAIYNSLSRTKPMVCDELSSTGYATNKLLAALTMLELKGLILSMPGGGFVKA